MPKERSLIDFKLIWGKINHTLSAKEDIFLSKWLDESNLHQQYFDRAKRFYNQGSSFIDTKAETERAWREMQGKLNQGNQYRNRWILPLTVGIVAIFLIVILTIKDKKIEPSIVATTQNETVQSIPAGTNKAILTLNDGSIHNLTSAENLILTEDGASISSEGTKLKYTEKDIVPQKIKYNTLTVPRGGEFSLQLSDGTKVWLNSESVLHYPVQFSEKERRVELMGEAFFEVSRNEKSPFFVESGQQTVKVFGTEFNISCYKENQFVYTTLVNGSVEVFCSDNPEIRQILAPNEQSILGKSDERISKQEVDPYQYVSWKEGRFAFRDQNLLEIMNKLAKWYDVEVIFAKEDLKEIKFTGNLKRYEDFGEVLKKIEKTREVEFEINGKKITIR
ncbi:MAG: FecR domain-containing protein [Prolixibacteraceae bacterium]